MKEFIKYTILNHIEEILEKSLLNCHTKGLHSIMLQDIPERRIRMFITDETHDMHENRFIGDINNNLTIAIHPHHCDLMLHVVYGKFINYRFIKTKLEKDNPVIYNRWKYTSKVIGNNEMKFLFDGSDNIKIIKSETCHEEESIILKAEELHTVFCPKGTVNAWLVFEGKEDKNYKPYAWSNMSLDKLSSEGFYIKPNKTQIIDLLASIGINCNPSL